MSVDVFEASLRHSKPPEGWGHAMQALWWEARGDWDRAHSLVQMDEADRECAWVHAYLHRKEGDLSNAAYWYQRAGHPMATCSFAEERQAIATGLLGRSRPE
ncbi:hypothetical protein AB4097_11280 [Microvirga sp. 2MCAF35]|uniref:hypothetical protein n=1 Tax=Microvirga sp. 2MCAF35 TaxID=3232987 RepID=UPI003F9E7BC6